MMQIYNFFSNQPMIVMKNIVLNSAALEFIYFIISLTTKSCHRFTMSDFSLILVLQINDYLQF